MKRAAVVLLFGCTSHATPMAMVDAPAMETAAACTFLEGKTFTATEERECGLGPSGPVPCHWHVAFENDGSAMSQYAWSHSDVQESGKLTCVGFAITVMPESAATLAATFDPATSTLHWDDLDYTP